MSLRAVLLFCPAEKTECKPAAANDDERGEEHKTQVMLGENARDNAHTDGPNANERTPSLRGCFQLGSEAMGGGAKIE